MQFSAAQIAMIVEGKVEGDPTVVVDSFGKIEEAGPGQLAFLANPKLSLMNPRSLNSHSPLHLYVFPMLTALLPPCWPLTSKWLIRT
jgi:hypothetical protein